MLLSSLAHKVVFIVGFLYKAYLPFINTKQKKEYLLKVDGYFYCQKENTIMVILQVRNKRIIDTIAISEAVNDNTLINELHPLDACIIGILSNNARNGVFDKRNSGWQNMKRLNHNCCFIKNKPVLQVVGHHFNSHGNEMTVLKCLYLNKEIIIPTIDLSNNPALLYALDSSQAVSIGYDASESHMRQISRKMDNARKEIAN